MSSRGSMLLTLAIILATASAVAAQSVVRLSGSTTVNLMVVQGHKGEIEKMSGAKIEVVPNNSPNGLADLVAGRSDIAMISSPLAAVAAKVNEKQPGAVDVAALKETRLGESKLILIVNAGNPVTSLTIAQIRDIFAGKITNWKEVGGTDTPIILLTGSAGGGTRATFEDKVMKGVPYSPKARAVPNTPQVATLAKQLPGVIGTAHPEHDLSGVKVLKTNENIVQPLALVTKANAGPAVSGVVEAARKVAAR